MKFNIFVSTATFFVLSTFAYVVHAQRPPVDGYNDVVGLKDVPIADGFCDGKTQTETEIDLFHSVVTENTLHEPDGRLVYENVGKVRGNEVNLVVTVYEGEYTSSKYVKNGKGSNSAGEVGKGMFGNINLQTKKNDIHSGEGNFEMCFRDKETDELVTVDSFMWSVYDIDERNDRNNGIKEKFIIDIKQAQEYVLWPNTEESEVKLFCENFHLWPYKSASQVNQLPCKEGERIVFHSSTKGVGSDNPTDKDDLTDLQKSRSIQFTFVNTSCWRFTYNHYCPPDEVDNPKACMWYGGGNMLFAGSAKQLIEEGECVTEKPTQAPTNAPTTAPPTKIPSKGPTATPTKAPTTSPTASPTKSPTVSPTNAPTKDPTFSPTASPTKEPTASPTYFPTVSPTVTPTAMPTNKPTVAPTTSPSSIASASPTTLSPTPKVTRPPIITNGNQNDDDDLIFQPGCPKDLELISKSGETDIDLSRVVKVISQDTSTVKVSLNQGWDRVGGEDIGIDHIFYSFRPDTFDDKCYEERSVTEGTVFDTVTITCDVLKPHARLETCLADSLQNELLTVEDNATVPKCCHPDIPPNTPTVCFNIKISCKTECVDDDEDTIDGLSDFVRRGLRGSN